MRKEKKIRHNPKGITKEYLLQYILKFEWQNEYEIRNNLIEKFPDIFSHRTKLATIRHYHLDPLERAGKIQSRINTYEKEYKKIPEGIEEILADDPS